MIGQLHLDLKLQTLQSKDATSNTRTNHRIFIKSNKWTDNMVI